MRSNPAHFRLKTPQDLSQALALLAESKDSWTLFAGGTDVMVLFEAGLLKERKYLGLWGLPELKAGIDITKSNFNFVFGAGFFTRDGRYSPEYISNYLDVYVKDALKRVPGVGDVLIFGERKYAMRVWLEFRCAWRPAV